jgi:hypothetical protein
VRLIALPFLGVTVTVTLHDPAFTACSFNPTTLQYLLDERRTFSDTLEDDVVLNFA